MFTKNKEFDYDGFMDWLRVNLLMEMFVDDRTADQEAANAQLAMARPISQEDGE